MRNNIQTNPLILSILGFILLSSITVTVMYQWDLLVSLFVGFFNLVFICTPFVFGLAIIFGIFCLFYLGFRGLIRIFGMRFMIAMLFLFLLLWIAPTLVNLQDRAGRTIFHLNGEFTFIASATIVGIIILLTYAFKKNGGSP